MDLKEFFLDIKFIFIVFILVLLGSFAMLVRLVLGNIFQSQLVQKIILFNAYLLLLAMFIFAVYALYFKKTEQKLRPGHAINRL